MQAALICPHPDHRPDPCTFVISKCQVSRESKLFLFGPKRCLKDISSSIVIHTIRIKHLLGPPIQAVSDVFPSIILYRVPEV